MRRHSFTPQGLTYDKGFTAESFQELCHALETQTRVVWPHHHQANAPLERCNRTLQGGIKAIIAGWNAAMDEPALPYWHVASEFCTGAFNNHPAQELGGVSPVFAELGRLPAPIAQATHPALHALPSDPLPDAIMRHHLALATRDAIASAQAMAYLSGATGCFEIDVCFILLLSTSWNSKVLRTKVRELSQTARDQEPVNFDKIGPLDSGPNAIFSSKDAAN